MSGGRPVLNAHDIAVFKQAFNETWKKFGATKGQLDHYSGFCNIQHLRVFHINYRTMMKAPKHTYTEGVLIDYGRILRRRLCLCLFYRLIKALDFKLNGKEHDLGHAMMLNEVHHMADDVNELLCGLPNQGPECSEIDRFLAASEYFLVPDTYFSYWHKHKNNYRNRWEQQVANRVMTNRIQRALDLAKHVAHRVKHRGSNTWPLANNPNTISSVKTQWRYRNQRRAKFTQLVTKGLNVNRQALRRNYFP